MKKVIIVGGGIAGLTAGILAQKQGYSTIIVEKHSKVGGNLTGWERDGYKIDNCIHWLTGTNKNSSEHKKLLEIGVLDNFYMNDSFYTTHLNGQSISMYKDLDKTKEEMLFISKEDEKEIIRFINAVKSVKLLQNMGGETNDVKGTLFQKFKGLSYILHYFNKSLGDLSSNFKHPLLKLCIDGFIGDKFSALGLIFAYACFSEGNGKIPFGGSMEVASQIRDKYLSLGGKILTNTTAVKVNSESNFVSVNFKDKPTLYSDYAILAVDLENAYKLLNENLPQNVQKRLYNPKFARFSSFHTAFSCDLKNLNFKGEQILYVDEKHKDVIKAKTIAIREFSKEKTFAPNNKTVIQAMFFVGEQDSKRWIDLKNNQNLYFAEKLKISQTIMEILTENFPALKQNLKIIDAWTPATYNRFFGEKNGSYMSNILPKSTIPSTFKNYSTKHKNVIFATQWLSLIGGLPIAINSGYKAIGSLLRLERQNKRALKFKNATATE